MLNYDLVTSTARYRLPTRDDLPALFRLAGECALERSAEKQGAVDQIMRTVKQLSKRPDRGSIFLFERNEDLVGYCVLVTCWSNLHGGEVLRIDELYVERRHRDEGLVEDFLRLLGQVAPKGTSAILFDASARDRKTTAFCADAGFEGRESRIMIKRIGDDAPPNA
ncbi:MAG TPA: GNAT family N-acetyltransferase [Spirochaetia bacterium]|nr:GNAT family N-acetyltransferase [Spirochaetia bacterium]